MNADTATSRPLHGGFAGAELGRADRVIGLAGIASSAGEAMNACAPEDDGRVGPHALGLAAQAWCQSGTSHKVMDPDLAYAFARILERELRKPWLGNASTGELLGELASRCDMSYRTVGRR